MSTQTQDQKVWFRVVEPTPPPACVKCGEPAPNSYSKHPQCDDCNRKEVASSRRFLAWRDAWEAMSDVINPNRQAEEDAARAEWEGEADRLATELAAVKRSYPKHANEVLASEVAAARQVRSKPDLARWMADQSGRRSRVMTAAALASVWHHHNHLAQPSDCSDEQWSSRMVAMDKAIRDLAAYGARREQARANQFAHHQTDHTDRLADYKTKNLATFQRNADNYKRLAANGCANYFTT